MAANPVPVEWNKVLDAVLSSVEVHLSRSLCVSLMSSIVVEANCNFSLSLSLAVALSQAVSENTLGVDYTHQSESMADPLLYYSILSSFSSSRFLSSA